VSNILLTGATGRVGRATIARLASNDHEIAAVGRDATVLDDVVSILSDRGSVGHAVVADLADRGTVRTVIDAAIGKMGGIDVIINNAAAFGFAPFQELGPDRIDQLIDLNIRAVLQLTHQALPQLEASPRAAIINIASTAGRSPVPEAAVYSATKAAIIAFGKAFRSEALSRGIVLVTLVPGQLRLSDDVAATGLPPAAVAEVVGAIVDDPSPARWAAEIDI
jgi:3-oxoacyl-[acyl-carrier protein] reductase